jgi:peptidoglycan/xylan/chitin deacetylase (PgdA/CDA1 family)
MDRYTVSPKRFAEQMGFLARQGWRVIALDDLFETGSLGGSGKTVALTFDDGFASNRQHAWPVLMRSGFRATTFVVTDQLGGSNCWDDVSAPRYPLLTVDDIRSTDPALMTFHSHSATHASLDTLRNAPLTQEVRDSRVRLEAITGQVATLFAYPFGRWDWRVVRLVRAAGYRAACTCMGGLNSRRTNPLLLRRVEILNEDLGWRFRLKLLTGRHVFDGYLRPPSELQFLSAPLGPFKRSYSDSLRR